MRYFVTGKQAAEIDRYTIEEVGVPQLVLMERASLAVAEAVEELVSDRNHDRILVVAESGNNGGDGVAAARILHQRGFRVDVWLPGGLPKQSEAYKKQVELAGKAGVRMVNPAEAGECGFDEDLTAYRVIVDSIFGVGLTREVQGIQKDAVEKINAARETAPDMTVLAVDIPSGISSETGEVLGVAVKADITVTFGYEKVGMRFAKNLCGAVSVKEIGFYLPDPYAVSGLPYGYDESDVRRLLPARSSDGNKGSFGHVLVVAGSKDMSGAAFLAAEAAYRTGCGLVKVVTHESNRPALQQLLPEAILKCYDDTCHSEGALRAGGTRPVPNDQAAARSEESREPDPILTEAELRWASAVILGPGLGQSPAALSLTETVLRYATCPVIADADAINLLSEHPELLAETAGKRPLVLTPHMLEMTRLVNETVHPDRKAVDQLRQNRITVTMELAKKYQAVIALKDACTLVLDGSKEEADTFLNTSGNDAMAKGGSGDVLTGVIAGLIAEGLPAPEAARLGVYLHGLAGDAARKQLGAYSVIARDLIDQIPMVMEGGSKAEG